MIMSHLIARVADFVRLQYADFKYGLAFHDKMCERILQGRRAR
ncbi:hypothetical protein BGLT_04635 [Caballeronia glathei]|jgi:hypothetical protein|nr:MULTISPECIES: hypothetical protein [Burkholderiaceae]TCK43690.1 hypothetical protein B0G84_2032 [Paraburkholderia sp. BL8N3]CDY75732.1 hypothetical protein BGLT_04635 [Caballeronia glathei]